MTIIQILRIHLLRPLLLVRSLAQALEFIGFHPTSYNSNWCVQLRTRKNPIHTSWIRGWRRRHAHLWAWSALVTSMALGLWSEESWSLQCSRHSRCRWAGWSEQRPLTEKGYHLGQGNVQLQNDGVKVYSVNWNHCLEYEGFHWAAIGVLGSMG